MRVLLTGSRGFLGRVVARRLGELGHDVVGAVRRRDLDRHEVFVDLADPAPIRGLPGDIDAVVHAGAVVGGPHFSATTMAINAGGTARLLAWARAAGVRHFLHISSVAAYGASCVGEDRREATTSLGRFPLHPAYLRSKADAERHVLAAGVPYTVLRLPATLGAGDTVITPAIVPALLRDGVPWVLRRDRRVSTLWSRNAAEVIAAALARGPLGDAFNLADGEARWDELVAAFAAALGRPPAWRRHGARKLALLGAETGFQFMVACGAFGAHFPADKLRAALPGFVLADWRDGVREAVEAYRARNPDPLGEQHRHPVGAVQHRLLHAVGPRRLHARVEP